MTNLETLISWLGSGGSPVNQLTADDRALTCSECVNNVRGSWWQKVSSPVANAIQNQLGLKATMSLVTVRDGELGTCGICQCNLPLKVWCPLEHITTNTPEKTMSKFPDWCWIKKESL